ncbi:MAG: hypothetical protein JXB47_17100 [Anaerolineae bacterium]|nr:hypothetical protein [Anaerolineae bacterium]
MKCWVCEEPAQAICKFCGRALCKDHVSKMPYIAAVYVGNNRTPKLVVIADTIWCGICKPQAEPIEMPEIY